MSLQFRPITQADYPVIHEIGARRYETVRAQEASAIFVQLKSTKLRTTYLALSHDAPVFSNGVPRDATDLIIGVLRMHIVRDSTLWLDWMALHPGLLDKEIHGAGYGRQILQFAINIAAKGMLNIRLYSMSCDSDRFYENMGFWLIHKNQYEMTRQEVQERAAR